MFLLLWRRFVLEQLSELDDISYKAMMGEYIIYYRGKIVGGVYDDRFLVKPVKTAKNMMPEAELELPYEGAKTFEPTCRQACTYDEYKRMEMAFFEKEKNISDKRVKLDPVQKEDIDTLWRMQVETFTDILDKYQDFDLSPAAESIDKVIARFEQPWTKYYFIIAVGIKVGAIRVVDKQDGSRKRISPIWIMPKYRNKGYAQQAILAAEKIFGSDHWCLDTILQEEGNLHLYEKLGYHQTGRVDKINDRMDIVYYEKD